MKFLVIHPEALTLNELKEILGRGKFFSVQFPKNKQIYLSIHIIDDAQSLKIKGERAPVSQAYTGDPATLEE